MSFKLFNSRKTQRCKYQMCFGVQDLRAVTMKLRAYWVITMCSSDSAMISACFYRFLTCLRAAVHQLRQDKHQDMRQKGKKLTSASWLRPVCGSLHNLIRFSCAPFFASCRRRRVLTVTCLDVCRCAAYLTFRLARWRQCVLSKRRAGPIRTTLPYNSDLFRNQDIQCVPGGKVSILGGHYIRHFKQKLCIHMYLILNGFQDRAISLYSSLDLPPNIVLPSRMWIVVKRQLAVVTADSDTVGALWKMLHIFRNAEYADKLSSHELQSALILSVGF
jgi:hypothetical protein